MLTGFNCFWNSQFTAQARRAAEEASRSVQEASRTIEDITVASKNTIDDLTKSAKHAASKGGLLKVNPSY